MDASVRVYMYYRCSNFCGAFTRIPGVTLAMPLYHIQDIYILLRKQEVHVHIGTLYVHVPCPINAYFSLLPFAEHFSVLDDQNSVVSYHPPVASFKVKGAST